MARQDQKGGEGSTNVQAGRDIAIYEGISAAEAREIALGVFHQNFIELSGIAEDVARGRAETITNNYLQKLEERNPEALNNASDPDVQSAVFDAQREFACSGEIDLQEVLVDLMVDRTGRRDRDIQTLVLNEAIRTVSKLTQAQRRAVALSFIFRYARYHGSADLDAFYESYLQHSVLPLATEIPKASAAYQHIEYVGAGAIGLGSTKALKAVSSGVTGLFSKGFRREEIPAELAAFVGDKRIFRTALRDSGELELAITQDEELRDLVDIAGGDESLAPHLEKLRRTMSDNEIEHELVSRLPEAQGLLTTWDDTPLKQLTLTSVGMAIGHGYWRRVTGGNADLGIWIHE